MSILEWTAIIGMALVTYLTRVGGLLLPSQHRHLSGFADRFLNNLPAALLAALISPNLAVADLSIWGAVLVTVIVVWFSRNTLLGVTTGTGTCALIRWFMA